jgi:mutual gliding-motility protein MglA
LIPAAGAAGGQPASVGPSGPVRSVKVVYWGPGRSGKTTNLAWLHSRLRPELRGRLIKLDSPGERTIYFDCLPLDLEGLSGAPVRLRLYTVPGQPRFRLTRRLVLQGVGGLVFVWDSRPRRLRENVASLLEARETLRELGQSWDRLPRVVQFNKQDLPERIVCEQLNEILGRLDEPGPGLPATALTGDGVLQTLTAIVTAALRGAPAPDRYPAAPPSDTLALPGPIPLPAEGAGRRESEDGCRRSGSGWAPPSFSPATSRSLQPPSLRS